MSFPRANDYLIRIPQGDVGKPLVESFEVAVLSNPFVGYISDIESMRSTFLSDRYFHVRNYDGTAYVVNYKLNFGSLFSKVRNQSNR